MLLQDLKIIGTQKTLPFTKFHGLAEYNRSTLKSLHLELVEFDPDFLVKELNGCTNLEHLVLKNTNWNKMRFTQKVELRLLTKFELELRNWDLKSSTPEEILSFFFVYKSSKKGYNSRAGESPDNFIPSLGYESELSVNGVDILQYSEARILYINFLPFDISPHFRYRGLYLRSTTVNVSTLRNIEYELSMIDVNFTNGGAYEISAKCKGISSFNVDFSRSPTMEIIDLAIIPNDLNTIVLKNARLWTSVPNLSSNGIGSMELKNSELNLTFFSSKAPMQNLELTNTTFIGGNISFIKVYGRLRKVILREMKVFDISNFLESRRRLEDFQCTNTLLTHSTDIQLSTYYLMMDNCKFDELTRTQFASIFKSLYIFEIRGNFEYLSSILMESIKTPVNTIKIFLNDNQRVRNKPQFNEINEFLNSCNAPPYATRMILTLKDGTCQSAGYVDDYTQNPYLRDFTLYIYTVPLFLVCIFGILGNIISAVVLSTKEMRSSTSCILLGLTVCDMVILGTYITSALYFGLKFVFMFWKFSIPESDMPVLWFQVSKSFATRMDNLQSAFLYPLNKSGNYRFFFSNLDFKS